MDNDMLWEYICTRPKTAEWTCGVIFVVWKIFWICFPASASLTYLLPLIFPSNRQLASRLMGGNEPLRCHHGRTISFGQRERFCRAALPRFCSSCCESTLVDTLASHCSSPTKPFALTVVVEIQRQKCVFSFKNVFYTFSQFQWVFFSMNI